MDSRLLLSVHAAVTHFPIALLLTGAAFEVGAHLLKKKEWQVVSFWLLAAAVAGAAASLLTGWFLGAGLFGSALASRPAIFARHRTIALITTGLAVLLLAWRIARRDADKSGAAALAASLVFVLTAITAGYTGYLGGEMVLAGRQEDAEGQGGNAAIRPPDRTSVSQPTPSVDTALVAQGEKAFQTYRCTSCHRMNGVGADAGPDLTHEARRHSDSTWQLEHLKAPDKMTPGSAMPPQDDLPPDDLRALAAYLATRR